ncbi:TetR/AcrR family transcriptional regulator [Nonomuraea sp. NPDC049309]|uniref:TetR/AcrR family transcriptional regulator n=1 Tax=Nonomuraea sp. NPDC049309 TaxID=3364350 RepID=UPI003712CDCD
MSGLRELKKQRTRAAIADAALELFLARGFDEVKVAEVARAAGVSEATVFNYFRTKEDLVFERLDRFWTRLIDAIEHRPGGQGIVDAAETFLLSQEPTSLSPEHEERLAAISRMIAASPALLARERASYDHAALALTEVIARTTTLGEDAAAAAHLILAVHKSLVAYTREQVLAGATGQALAHRVAARTRSGYALLRRGLDA